MRSMLRSFFLIAGILSIVYGHASSAPWTSLNTCQTEYEKLAYRLSELDEAKSARAGDSARAASSISRGRRLHAEQLGAEGEIVVNLVMVFCCVLLAALAAGLTMGLMSLDPMELEVMLAVSEQDVPGILEKQQLRQDKQAAEKVLPLISEHHRLLVTLLLMNSLANEALPIFLDKLVPSWAAVALSVSLVLVFGEILPSAIFTGRDQLRYVANFATLVSFCQKLLCPLGWPIAKVLDRFLGLEHNPRRNFAELRAMVGIHVKTKGQDAHKVEIKKAKGQEFGIITSVNEHHFEPDTVAVYKGQGVPGIVDDSARYYLKPCYDASGHNKNRTFQIFRSEKRDENDLIVFTETNPLLEGVFEVQERDEHKLMRGITEITEMMVNDPRRMKPLDKVDMLEMQEQLTKDKLMKIDNRGFSRLPVYRKNKHNIRGYLLVKNLIVLEAHDGYIVEDLRALMIKPVAVHKNVKMLELLNKFQEHKTHFAIVTDCPESVEKAWEREEDIPPHVHMAGILTIEDIFEQILQEEVDDEFDDQPTKSKSFWSGLAPTNTRSLHANGTITEETDQDLECVGKENSGFKEPLLGTSEKDPGPSQLQADSSTSSCMIS